MSRRWLLSLFCLSVPLLLFVQGTRAGGTLNIIESDTQFRFGQEESTVVLALENSEGRAAAIVRLDLLTPENTLAASVEQRLTLSHGRLKINLTIPFKVSQLQEKAASQLPWYRLRCRIGPAASSGKLEPIETVISLSQITPELFELRGFKSPMIHEGMRHQTRVRAAHPLTTKPAAGVELVGKLSFTDKGTGRKDTLKAFAKTDRDGYALLQFDFPRNLRADDLELTIAGTRGQLTVQASKELLYYDQPNVMVSTDKPIYKPGQTLHVRALAFGLSMHALAGQTLTLKITDPEDTLLFRSTVQTNRFGVGNVDWSIPDSSRLGDYSIAFELHSEQVSMRHFKVSRYELPNFSVTAKPDRSYYLPGQNAEVEVRADYLFGQPVTRGRVRVVRETDREWNNAAQKYDIKEGDKYEGETDAQGRFRATIDLGKDYEELKEEDRRFHDVRYAAYFTDPTTNRTEQRRFDLRLTREAIHVYVIYPNDRSRLSRLQPVTFYLSTFYADGTPARCQVKIFQKVGEDDEIQRGRLLSSVRTNRFGVARVDHLPLPKEVRDGDDLNLRLTAADRSARLGTLSEEIRLDDDASIRVDTNKPLYARGEPVEVTITSNEPGLATILEVVRDWTIIHSERVRLTNGHAAIVLPYRKDFKDELTIVAYADNNEDDPILGSHRVLFPRNRNLRLDLKTTQEIYRPGENAGVNFRVRDREGRLSESALGVVVFDKAVEERARTDREFGSSGADFYGDVLGLLGARDPVAGLTRRDLDAIDLSQPLSPDLELAAEVFLNSSSSYFMETFGEEYYEKDVQRVFGNALRDRLTPVRMALRERYEKTREYPSDDESLRRYLADSGIDFDALHDPWDKPYHPVFLVDRHLDSLRLVSAGPDKRYGSDDDFTVESFSWLYFQPIGQTIDNALQDYHARTGAFVRDQKTLSSELAKHGVNIEALRDRWSRPYRFEFGVRENWFTLIVSSLGPNGRLDGAYADDFSLWTSQIDYFVDARAKMNSAVATWAKANDRFPQDEDDFREALRGVSIDLDAWCDAWDRPYSILVAVQTLYGDKARLETRARSGEASTARLDIKPVTRRIGTVKLHSAGPDGKQNTRDDFDIAYFSGLISEQSASEIAPQLTQAAAVLSANNGTIAGLIKDSKGAVIPGATVHATSAGSANSFRTISSDDGKYLFANLPPGRYEVRFEAVGFKVLFIEHVFVLSSSTTEVNATLETGTVSETVTVSAAAVETQTQSADVSIISSRQVRSLLLSGRTQNLVAITKSGSRASWTPRLREYFPETLLWQPSLETDRQGRAQINFKLADNITTWKMAVIGSTEDGQLGTVEREIKSFQPFFVEHDPPRVLTEGDEISLPVVVRNYLARAQSVELDIKPENWFAMLGPAHKRAQVAAGDAVRQTFDLRAVASVKDGKQRITASAAEDNDAIEKPVTVHPDGEEQSTTSSDVVIDKATLDLDIPATVIPNSMQGELKIYPNLMGHVSESVEAIMKRPYGCGEQTISSTYPSLLLLRYDQQTRPKTSGTSATGFGSLRPRAERYLNEGYNRLLNYRDTGGGFTYWGRGYPDLALTAYALRFLNDASSLIEVDSDVVDKASAWLFSQQAADGRWSSRAYGSEVENKGRTVLLTAYIARVLAAIQLTGKLTASDTQKDAPQKVADQSVALKRALDFLSHSVDEIDEPYLLAAYALASFDAGDTNRASGAVAKLRALAHTEGNTTYWSLETNTPFYGWGLAGRVETTALAVQALARSQASSASTDSSNQILTPQAKARDEASDKGDPLKASPASQTNDHLVRSGLLFLLKEKDRYGVWYSTQATINVLDALLLLLQSDRLPSPATPGSSENFAEIFVNGQPVQAVPMPPLTQFGNPITVDVSRFLRAASNRIEVRRATNSSPASVQAVVTYYVPWSASSATRDAGARAGDSSGLRLVAKFGGTEGRVGDEITCHVEAERVGFRGYGMMLAEIGLPPGADVDRASLETAMKSSGWAMSQYDILPDRVVVYLWPAAGGVKFDFKFRLRFGLKAQTAPSVIYDYYNPEARAVVAPVLFTIK